MNSLTFYILKNLKIMIFLQKSHEIIKLIFNCIFISLDYHQFNHILKMTIKVQKVCLIYYRF